MMEISRVFNVKNVYTYPNPGGQEDEIHIEIVGIGRVIVPKSSLRKLATVLLDANRPVTGPAKEHETVAGRYVVGDEGWAGDPAARAARMTSRWRSDSARLSC